MLVPEHDWIADLSETHKDALREKFPKLWDTYSTYGYSLMCYDFSQQLKEAFDLIHTVSVTATIELPDDRHDAIRKLIDTNKAYGNLNDIVVSVPNYHLTVLTDSCTVMSEVSKHLKDFVCVQTVELDDVILRCGCTAVLIDDVNFTVDEDTLDVLELNAVPFIRRSVLGWTKAYMSIESINILQHFVNRMKPCRRIL